MFSLYKVIQTCLNKLGTKLNKGTNLNKGINLDKNVKLHKSTKLNKVGYKPAFNSFN